MRSSLALLTFVVAACGCRAEKPRSAGDAVTLMTRYGTQHRYDDAIRTGEEWVKSHPEDTSHEGPLYGQIAIAYLMKAASDDKHKEEWIEKAVACYDKELSTRQAGTIDVTLFDVGHGFASAGDLSVAKSCLYYGRAMKAFKEQAPLLQADNATVNGKTYSLAPLREENEKAKDEVKGKLARLACK